jgi:hypothetical protein
MFLGRRLPPPGLAFFLFLAHHHGICSLFFFVLPSVVRKRRWIWQCKSWERNMSKRKTYDEEYT